MLKETTFNVPGPALENLNATYLAPPYPGHFKVSQWMALGDSISADPGAGCPVDGVKDECRRNEGAYAPQMRSSGTFIKDMGIRRGSSRHVLGTPSSQHESTTVIPNVKYLGSAAGG